MKLNQILEEISVGINNVDQKSEKLRRYINMVREAFQEEGAILESRTVKFSRLGNDLDNGLVFLQGSYSCGTAIKHKKYEVDADIGFLAEEELDLLARNRIFTVIQNKFASKFECTLKKPCITIDFKDGYKIDIAIYSTDLGGSIYFHNSISGIESKTQADPRGFVDYLRQYFKSNEYRSIIRLSKHFIKTLTENLGIDSCDRIPSVSLCLFASASGMNTTEIPTEDDMNRFLLDFFNNFRKMVQLNTYAGPNMPRYFVDNTFYKVRDISKIIRVLDVCIANIQDKNYGDLISKEVFESLRIKNNIDKTAPLMGTLGNG